MANLISQMMVEEYRKTVEASEGVIIISLAGMTVQEVDSLRGSLHDGGARLRMVRNSLARRVLRDVGYEVDDDVFAGNVALAYGSVESTVHAAKVLSTPELKKSGKVTFKAGVMEQTLLAAEEARALAAIPDHQTLRGMLVGCIQAPSRGLATSLAGLPGGLARVLQAHVDAGGSE